jgi:hypothetical protein
MYGSNRFIKTPEELFTLMKAFGMAPDNEIGNFIVDQTERIIELERRIRFQDEVIDTQKKQLERFLLRANKDRGRVH